MPRGGKRPGAGARPGNLNALKHGRRSAQVHAVALLLASIPQVQRALTRLEARRRGSQRQAERTATALLHQLAQRAASNDQTFLPILDSLDAEIERLTAGQSNPVSGVSAQSDPPHPIDAWG